MHKKNRTILIFTSRQQIYNFSLLQSVSMFVGDYYIEGSMQSSLWRSVEVVLIAALATFVLPMDDVSAHFPTWERLCRNARVVQEVWSWRQTLQTLVVDKKATQQKSRLYLPSKTQDSVNNSRILDREREREVSTSYVFWSSDSLLSFKLFFFPPPTGTNNEHISHFLKVLSMFWYLNAGGVDSLHWFILG